MSLCVHTVPDTREPSMIYSKTARPKKGPYGSLGLYGRTPHTVERFSFALGRSVSVPVSDDTETLPASVVSARAVTHCRGGETVNTGDLKALEPRQRAKNPRVSAVSLTESVSESGTVVRGAA